jgi:transposase
VYGVLTDKQGCPVTVDVYEGNTSDSTTVTDQVLKLRDRFGVERAVLVGDRGMLTSTQIAKLKEHEGLGWISALRSCEIKQLLDDGHVQLGLFDEKNLLEITSADYP